MPDEDITTRLSKTDTESILELARERFSLSYTLDKDARDEAVTDLKFINGDQWPKELQDEREEENRPALVIDKVNEKIRQVIGDHRQNRQQIKVNPVDDDADTDTADVLSGLVRNIEYQSHAASVYTTALESGVRCGRGFWRVVTEYANDMDFDQEIFLRRVPNVLSVYWDQNGQDLFFRDAQFLFFAETIGKLEYKNRYGKKFDPASLAEGQDDERNRLSHWVVGDSVRVAEYWLKVPDPDRTKTLYLVSTGKSADGDEQFDIVEKPPANKKKIVKRREVKGQKIINYQIDGKNLLSGPHDWVSHQHFPLIPVWGEEVVIEGERFTRGLVRLARDPQKMLNYFESMVTESVALAPKVPWVLTANQMGDHKEYWDKANSTLPYLLYDGDQQANGPPQRPRPAMVPTAYEKRAETNSEHIKSATGIYSASLGQTSNETSGKAILARQKEGDVGTFTFLDNLNWAIRHTGTVLVDMIPRVYDTQQTRRILGEDGEHSRVELVNSGEGHKEYTDEKGRKKRRYDLSVGKYDVAVTTGPSFTTQRQEAAQAQMELVQAAPEIMQFIGHLMVKNMDWPESQKAADLLKHYLHPAVQAEIAAEEDAEEGGAAGGGMEQAAMQQAMMTAEGGGLPEEQAEVDPAADIKVAQEQVKLEKMQFDAQQAQFQAERERFNMMKAEHEAERARAAKDEQYAELGIDPDQTREETGAEELASAE